MASELDNLNYQIVECIACGGQDEVWEAPIYFVCYQCHQHIAQHSNDLKKRLENSERHTHPASTEVLDKIGELYDTPRREKESVSDYRKRLYQAVTGNTVKEIHNEP